MREELADLLARQNGYTSLLAMPASQRDNWRKRADAVLDALMEPDIDMVGNGVEEWCAYPDEPDLDVENIWRAMIQAAKDGK